MKIPLAVPVLLVSTFLTVTAATAQTCGDSIRDAGEQCDDGNDHNLDGCNASCQFEQTHRLTSLKLQRLPDPACPANAFGGAFQQIAIDATQPTIDASVVSGATSILLHVMGLDDLTGATDDPALEVGVLSSTPVSGSGYNGTSDLDWWYTPAESLLDPADRLPANVLNGHVAASTLSAGPGAAEVRLLIGGEPASFSLSSMTVNVAIGASSVPLPSSGFPPGHLAAEQLDPGLQSFATAGTPADPGYGAMCGNVSAYSLKQTPIPSSLIGAACNNSFTALNSLLDVFVSGCNLFIIPVILATQPDQEDPGAPPAGPGPPYTLTASSPATRIVDGCRAGGMAVDLTTCLQDAAYSSYFKFTSDRVIARDDLLFADDFEAGI